MLVESDVKLVVEGEIRALLEKEDDVVSGLEPETQLGDLGFNSLSLARLIVQLENRLQVDPFQTGASIADMRSVGDLIRAYEQAAAGGQ